MITDEGAVLLAGAIVEQAIKDYRAALMKGLPTYSLEKFFMGDLDFFCDLDGQYIMDSVRRTIS